MPLLTALLAAVLVGLGGCSSSANKPAASTTTRATAPPPTTGATTTTAAAAGAAWPTYGGDASRSGRVATGPPAAIRRAWSSPTFDAAVYAQPVAAEGMIVAATERNSVYALAADTGAMRWHAQLGEAISGGSLPCGNIDPSGITGTPVIDTSRRIVLAVAFVKPAHHDLVALDLGTGAIRWRTPIDPPGADPTVQQQRAALAIDGDQVLVGFGGLYGDCGGYHGYLVSAGLDGSGIRASYRVPAPSAAAIWATPGPVVVAGGDVFVSTGNATTGSGSPDLSNSVLRLTPQLSLRSSFTPANRDSLSAADADLGSLAPALLDGNRLFQAGKEGVGYLLDGDHLSGSATLSQSKICNGGAYGGTAYAPPRLFVPCRSGLVVIDIGTNAFSVAWRTSGFNAGPPVIGGSTVWTIDLSAGVLHAYDVATGHEQSNTTIGAVEHFTTPTILGNQLLVATQHRIDAYVG